MSSVQEVKVPDIGGTANVEVIEVLVKVGDTVETDQGLITLETDKATMEIPSPQAGVVKALKVSEGDKVSEGSLIVMLDVAPVAAELSAPVPEKVASAAIADAPAEAPVAAALATKAAASAENNSLAPSSLGAVASPVQLAEANLLYASPSVRAFARELGVDLRKVSGSGSKGRITRLDVQDFVKSQLNSIASGGQSSGAIGGGVFANMLPWPKVDFAKFGPIERQPLSRIRKISGANLHRNWVSIPHVTNHEDADITELEAFRVQLNKEQSKAKTGTKVTLLALLIKACVAALKQFPDFNASLDGDELILKGYYHIGFAADTPNGLVVPVIRDADKKGILEIATEMSALSAKAREGKLSVAEMSGGCFSISSLGGIGGTYFTPIINAPEVAILGVSKSRYQMIWNGREAEPRLVLPLSLSWDHRAVDGAMAGRFNAYLAAVLADFRRVML
ncbi:MAG: pyruvate dehydrogenase E2 component (dihydrolipoamide acetyltransferase) [Marinomonas primoryensis]|jgi:pyruvate dehydrogenase E2 component (dihydrolipoamide acetyltransferase)